MGAVAVATRAPMMAGNDAAGEEGLPMFVFWSAKVSWRLHGTDDE